jgi:dTDP-4-dehydrorhamnose reductase
MATLGHVVAIGREQCDLADSAAITDMVRGIQPNVIINPAAYTAVDNAERDAERAFAVNATAPAVMAELANEAGAAMIHYSTDYVFDGQKQTPYVEGDQTNPLSTYGKSKCDGERAVREALDKHVILRTSWVFGTSGTNFLKKMIQLATERDALSVVSDQVGAPTSTALLAGATTRLIAEISQRPDDFPYGTYHLSARGETSWYDYAIYAIEEARRRGVNIRVKPGNIRGVPTSEFPSAAKRPANSRLDTTKFRSTFGFELPQWQKDVSKTVEILVRS